MAILQVLCHVPDGSDPDQRIDALGGVFDGTQTQFNHLIDEVIYNIENFVHSYYVMVNGQLVWCRVVPRNNRKYVKTETDYYEPNNLLNLPKCW